ncbi:MAG: LamG-like jellyroll fold domain-containing protein [Halopenitus sp.]
MSDNHIGDVEVGAIENVDDSRERPEEEILFLGSDDPVVVNHEPGLEELSISTALHEAIHSEGKQVDLQAKDLLSLLDRAAGSNSFDYLDWTGHLSIEDVDTPRSGDQSTLIRSSISATYLPYPDYKPALTGNSNTLANDFNIERAGTFTLPSFVENVKVRNPINGAKKSLSPVATEATEDGNIDIYTVHPWGGVPNANILTDNGVSKQLELKGYGLQRFDLTASGDLVELGIDRAGSHYQYNQAPEGEYTVKTRIKDSNQVSDDVRVKVRYNDGAWKDAHSELFTVTGSYGIIETSEFTLPENDRVVIQIKKETANTNTISVPGAYLEPQFTPEILFDVEVGRELDKDATLWHRLNAGSGSVSKDSSPNRIDGDIVGADWIDNSRGTGLKFNSSNGDHVILNGTKDFYKGKFTVSAWFVDNGSVSNVGIVSKADNLGAYDSEWALELQNSAIFRVDSTDGSKYTTSTPYSQDTLHHIVGVFTGDKVKLYLDGDLKDSISFNGEINANNLNIVFGRESEARDRRYLNGEIYSTTILPFAASDSVINSLYEMDRPALDPIESFNAPDRVSPVRVYDDMGSNNEDDWVRVHNEDHALSGNLVVQNGILRWRIVEDNEIQGSVRTGDGYEHMFGFKGYATGPGQGLHKPSYSRILDLSPHSVTFRVVLEQNRVTRQFDVTLKNGGLISELVLGDKWTANDDFGMDFGFRTSAPYKRFGNTVDTIYDSAVNRNISAAPYQWCMAWDPNEPYIFVNGFTEDADIRFLNDGTNLAMMDNKTLNTGAGETIYWGAIPFSEVPNLHIEAENASYSSGAAVNHWEMPLGTSGNLNEFSGDTTPFTEDTTNNLLAHTSDNPHAIFLNALIFGKSETSNHYRWSTQASDTTNSEHAKAYFATDGTTSNGYYVILDFTNDNIKLIKADAGSNTAITTDTSFTLSYGTTYHTEVEWDPSTGAIDAYVWADGNGKPSSASLSGSDSTHSSGQVGYEAYGSVDLHAFSVDAEETTSSQNNATIAKSNSITGSNENIRYILTTGIDVPLGTYLGVARVKQTNSGSATTMSVLNRTDGVDTSIDGGNKFDSIASELATSYNYAIREFRVDNDDSDDSWRVNVFNTEGNTVNHNVIDEFILVPVSLQAGGDRMGPQDIAHSALTEWDIENDVLEP